MKVLFIASNPPDADSLNLEREITELQRRFAEASGEPVAFTFLPGLNAENLPREIGRCKPDVLHISAHGFSQGIALTNEAGNEVRFGVDALVAFLPPDHLPRLVYLNACGSGDIAQELVKRGVHMAIGSTAPLTNRAARAAAVAFYERILAGYNVQASFDVAQHMIHVLQDNQASATLHAGEGIEPNRRVLHAVPRLIADFIDGDPTARQKKFYSVRFGMIGCAANTTQVVFFTDDETFIDPDEDTLSGNLCVVVRGTPVRGVVWVPPSERWEVSGDFRIFGVGVTGDRLSYSVASTLCDAVETFYRFGPEGHVPPDIAAAMSALRQEDGADLDYAPARRNKFEQRP